MLTGLRLKNFKGWAEADLPLAGINVFFGTNSSGKSSLLHSLLLIKQTVEQYDRSRALNFGDREKDYVELGSFSDVIFGHDKEAELHLGLRWATERPVTICPLHEETAFSYDAAFRFSDEQVALQNLLFTAGKVAFSLAASESGSFEAALQTASTDPVIYRLKDGPAGCHGLPHETTRLYQGALFPLEFSHEFESLFKKLRYLGPLRENPKRVYDWSGSRPSSVGLRGESAVQALLAALKTRAAKDRKSRNAAVLHLHEATSKWLQKLGLADELKIIPIDNEQRLFEVKLRIKSSGHDASIADVGVGVSQVLPVIVQLFDSPPGSILLFEQPEIHLHPSVQACLADLFIAAAEAMGHQLLIESHSEHFLVRLQRRIAEAQASLARPEKIKIYLCQNSNKGSVARELRLDQYGRIDEWPEDFFGNTLEDREAIMRAIITQQMETDK